MATPPIDEQCLLTLFQWALNSGSYAGVSRSGVKNTRMDSGVIFKGQQYRSLSFAGRFLENPSRLRQQNPATRLRSFTVFQ